jgi:hypothetical protein
MQEFFDLVWQTEEGAYRHLGELRAIKDGQVFSVWVDGLDGERATLDAARLGEKGMDVYFGVLPRTRRAGKAEDCVDETWVLWADVDAKKFMVEGGPIGGSKAEALRAINKFELTPQILVDSGGGFHAYWLLADPVPFERARKAMEYIAQEVNGDATYDAPRVLRVPGTINRKYGNYARVLRLDATAPRYRISDFPVIEPKPARPPHERVDWAGETTTPQWLRDLLEKGAPQGQRSEACFKAMVWLIRYGFDEVTIHDIFEANPEGIGEKLAEKYDVSEREGMRWFTTTFRAAERVA